MRGPRTATLLAAAATLSLGLAACGGSSSSGTAATASNGQNEMSKVSVGVIPIVDVAPLYLGIKKGFFSKHGLEVTPVPAAGGAAVVPAVIAEQEQFGFSNVVSLLVAREKGLAVESVAAGVSSTGNAGRDFNGVMVNGNSSLHSAKDLDGKTVAVNTLGNFQDATTRAAVEKAGGDPSTVKFVEVPFPDMPAALKSGKVDAVWVPEPFRSAILGSGGRVLLNTCTTTFPQLQVAQYFTSTQFAQQNPNTVKSFVAGIDESLQYANAHPEEVRAVMPTYTKITPTLAGQIVLPAWPTTLNKQSTVALGDIAQKFAVLSKSPDVTGLLGS